MLEINPKLKVQIINQRILRIKQKWGYEYLNATTITYSGQIHYAKKLLDEKIPMDDVGQSCTRKIWSTY